MNHPVAAESAAEPTAQVEPYSSQTSFRMMNVQDQLLPIANPDFNQEKDQVVSSILRSYARSSRQEAPRETFLGLINWLKYGTDKGTQVE